MTALDSLAVFGGVGHVPGLSYVERTQSERPGSLLAQMLTVRQAAVRMGLSESALRARMASGTAPVHHRLGKRVLFKVSDVGAG